MSVEIEKYNKDITTLATDKARVDSELDMARQIQLNMLPNIFPAFPDHKEFDIYASMNPAKEVGGDFYDFFMVDNDHLGLVIADVSGKGVPAALFMMMSKILIQNFALDGLSPEEVLMKTNEVICRNNPNDMFVTVWIGIVELSTGRLTACNAGHEYPVVRQPDGKFEFFKDPHGFVVGGMEGLSYQMYEIMLQPGATLFVYTDGVPEATNGRGEMYGPDKLLETLNQDPELEPQKILETVKQSVDKFVGDAPQFDDLTMLSIKLKK
jgi:sigma-B regulation protein RsbU (phosphoserine phosphatase)